MAYVPPEYPGEIPEFAEVWPPADDVHWMFTTAWDAMVKELRAALIELGTDPAGTFATVKARLDAMLPHFHDRGDPVGWDFDVDDLTTDGAYHDLDLSGIVPAGAKLVLIRVLMVDDAVSSIFKVRKNGNTNDINTRMLLTQIANIVIDDGLMVQCDTNRVIEYWASNLVWSAIFLAVRGWWK